MTGGLGGNLISTPEHVHWSRATMAVPICVNGDVVADLTRRFCDLWHYRSSHFCTEHL
jgi:hypothetical protein